MIVQRFLLIVSVMLLTALAASGQEKNAAPVSAGRAGADDVCDILHLAESGPLLLRLHIRLDGRSYRSVWQEQFTQMFRDFDEDNSGVLEPPEAARIGNPKQLRDAGLISWTSAPLPAITPDANPRDGKVTKNELETFYRKIGGGPLVLHVANTSGARSPQRLTAQSERLWRLLDLDRNGKLSKVELQAAGKLLSKLDVNDDDIISDDELRGPQADILSLSVNTSSDVSVDQQTGSRDPVFVDLGEVAPDELAGQLLEFYDGRDATGDRADKPAARDEKLSPREINVSRETFKRLDVDANGQLDTGELGKIATLLPPMLEVILRMGKKKPSQKRIELVPLKTARPTTIISTSRRGFPSVEVGGVQLTWTVSSRGTGSTDRVTDGFRQQFAALDKDKNKYLESNEVANAYYFRNAFKLIDHDGDGKILEKELLTFVEREMAASSSRMQIYFYLEGRSLFKLLDRNADRRLAVREIANAPGWLLHWDHNADGQISIAEVPIHVSVPVQPVSLYGRTYFLDGAFAYDKPPDSTRGPLWFRKMDRNQDGDLSPREFLGPIDEFKKFDSDDDGLIDATEAGK